MRQKLIDTLWMAAAWSVVTGSVAGADFTTGGGEILHGAQLLKTVSGTAYLAHDGGIAALPLTPELTAAFPAAADVRPVNMMRFAVEKWLAELKGGALASTTGAAPGSLLVVSAEKLAAYKKAVGEKYERLEAGGGKVFTEVTITKVNQAYVYFSHSNGASRALISDLSPEWAERFDFSPAEAAAFIEDEQAKRELAADHQTFATAGGIRIISALYGAESSWWDVREMLQNRINSGQTPVRVGSGSFGGDPIFGKVKSLVVKYSRNGQIIEAELREGEAFLPNPNAAAKSATARTEDRPSVDSEEVYAPEPPKPPAPAPNTNVIIRSKRPTFVPGGR